MVQQRSRHQRDDRGVLAERHRQGLERVGVLVPGLLHRRPACGTGVHIAINPECSIPARWCCALGHPVGRVEKREIEIACPILKIGTAHFSVMPQGAR